MTILNRATEQQQSVWRPVPEGMRRFVIGVPELKPPDKFPNYQVRWPLSLTQSEQARALDELGPLPKDVQQSYRVSYSTGLSLGYIKQGQFQSTRLIDFLAASLGHTNAKKFREWIASGGGPPRPPDKDDQQAELSCIESWLGWWENLEVYGTVSHAADSADPTRIFARFAGPIAVGALPGQKDDDYQALGRGKLRAIIVEAHPELAAERKEQPKPGDVDWVPPPLDDKPAVQFAASGRQVLGKPAIGDGSDDLPF